MTKILKNVLTVGILLATCLSAWAVNPEVNLVPWPQSLTIAGGEMALSESSRIIYSEPSLSDLADVVVSEISEITRLQLTKVQATNAVAGDIYLKITTDPAITGEKYKVVVANYATAEAQNYNAVAMASVTIIQTIKDNAGTYSIPQMTVEDAPDAGYRGFMIDVARQQHSIKTLKEMVDMCRLYKVRFIQIHFNDDQAYTLPSLTYPDITSKSSYSYTHAEVVDLVDYADKHGVIIIPEIETPAHASAMINAMPNLFSSPSGGVVNFADTNVWNALEIIINEACDIFQSAPYIHLGADEANLSGLDQNAEFQAAIATYNVGDVHGLFNYYISHLDDVIKARGKTTVVWEGFGYWNSGNAKMDTDVAVMMFDNAKSPQSYIDAGYKVINASWNPMYIVGFEGRGFGCPAHWIFQWDKSQFHGYLNYPMAWDRTKLNPLVPSDDVIGGQMCSWEMLEWRELPRVRFRIAPFADRIWNPSNTNDFAHFETRYNSTDVLLDYVLAEHRSPDAPINVAASDSFYEDKIRVGWGDGGNHPITYALYRNTANNSATATLISNNFPKTTTFYEDTKVNFGQTYYYWVKAENNWGWSDFSAVASGKSGMTQLAKAYEPFDYTVGNPINGENGGEGFSDAWKHIKTSGDLTILSESLSYSGVPSEGGAMKVDHTINEAAELSRHFNTAIGADMSEVWLSYMIKGEKIAYGWMTADLNYGQRFGKQSVNGLGIHYDCNVFMETDLTYLLVLYIDCRPGNDNMYLWVNPSAGQKPALDECDAIWETSDQPKGNNFRFNLSGTESGKYIIDELRIGSTWDDVIGVSDLDPDAPTPNPMTWKSVPASLNGTEITMECTLASHADGVEYFFEEISGNPGGDDSDWQAETTYTDSELSGGYKYTYHVKARNLSVTTNETAWSDVASFSLARIVTNEVVVNVDFQRPGRPTFSGQGVCVDPGNDYWNAYEEGDAVVSLLESNGNLDSGFSMEVTGSWGTWAQEPENANEMLGDYLFTQGDNVANISITGFAENQPCQMYLFLGGGDPNQLATVTMNGVTVNQTLENLGSEYVLDENYFVIDVTADASGVISGTFQANDTAFCGFKGMQILAMPIPEPSTMLFSSLTLLGFLVAKKQINS